MLRLDDAARGISPESASRRERQRAVRAMRRIARELHERHVPL